MSPCPKCGNTGCTAPRRMELGLGCFRDLPTPKPVDDGLFGSYSAAVAASPVGRARWVRGGGTSGSPARFAALKS